MHKVRILVYAAVVIASLLSFLYCEIWTTLLLLIIVLILPVVSGLISVFSFKKVSYRVLAPGSVRKGGRLDILVCDTGGVLTATYTVEVEIDDGINEPTRWVAELSGGTRRSISLNPEHCGLVRCRVRQAYAYDALGIIRFRLENDLDAVTVVLPVPMAPDPMPEIKSAAGVTFVPKYGGGYAEVHEIRSYRPGDTLRDIHWKLSAKTDEPMVREPWIPVQRTVLVTVDLTVPSAELDKRLAQLLWINNRLLGDGIKHDVCWIHPEDQHVCSFTLCEKSDIVPMLRELLSVKVTQTLPTAAGIGRENIDLHYHVTGEVSR